MTYIIQYRIYYFRSILYNVIHNRWYIFICTLPFLQNMQTFSQCALLWTDYYNIMLTSRNTLIYNKYLIHNIIYTWVPIIHAHNTQHYIQYIYIL